MGRTMARRLGYTDAELDAAPAESIESFAGVGYYFDLANLRPGEQVVDLGSGSGMDSFIAAQKVGQSGRVTGIDMTDAQLAKADRLRKDDTLGSVLFRQAFIDATGLPDQSCDAVIRLRSLLPPPFSNTPRGDTACRCPEGESFFNRSRYPTCGVARMVGVARALQALSRR